MKLEARQSDRNKLLDGLVNVPLVLTGYLAAPLGLGLPDAAADDVGPPQIGRLQDSD